MDRAELKRIEKKMNEMLAEGQFSPEEIADFAVRSLSNLLPAMDRALAENERLKKGMAKAA